MPSRPQVDTGRRLKYLESHASRETDSRPAFSGGRTGPALARTARIGGVSMTRTALTAAALLLTVCVGVSAETAADTGTPPASESQDQTSRTATTSRAHTDVKGAIEGSLQAPDAGASRPDCVSGKDTPRAERTVFQRLRSFCSHARPLGGWRWMVRELCRPPDSWCSGRIHVDRSRSSWLGREALQWRLLGEPRPRGRRGARPSACSSSSGRSARRRSATSA